LSTGDMSMSDIVRYAQQAEELGYEGFWVSEGDGKEAFSIHTAVAHGTRQLHLGTGIVSFYTRTPTLLAMGASTLYRLSGGRFIHFGIGTGGVGFTERGHGVKIERPLRRARETVEILRGLLSNPDGSFEEESGIAQAVGVLRDQDQPDPQLFSYDGQLFRLNTFRLREGPLNRTLPIYLSALGSQMITLAAKIADGIVTNGLTEEAYERYVALIKQGTADVGRDPSEIKMFTLMMMGVEDPAAIEAVRKALTFFFASSHYTPLMEVSGYGDSAKQIQQAWQQGNFAAASRFVTDAMVEKFAIMGSASQRRNKLRWMLDHNIYPILYPVWRPGHKMEDYYEILHLGASYLSQEYTPAHSDRKALSL
jgi:5,10-methylenetetrahydromethanopterin reductase